MTEGDEKIYRWKRNGKRKERGEELKTKDEE